MTIDTNGRALAYMNGEKNMDFISFEPLLTDPNEMMINWIKEVKWIIIGADSSKGADRPPDEWADKLVLEATRLQIPIWVKDNYKYHTRIKNFPEMSCNKIK